MFRFSGTRRRRVAAYVGAVVAATAVVAGVAVAATPFTDVGTNPNAADIDATYNAGITPGCTPTQFCPNDPAKRDYLAGALARTAGLSTPAAKRFPVANARADAQTFCSLVASSPRSFENGPCLGSAVNVETGTVGTDTAIALGADGLPVISYHDAKNGDLKVTRCGNPACTAGNQTSTLDATGVVGRFTAIAIGADGFPLVSYYDVTNGDLKVAHCVNVACSGNTTVSKVDTAGNVGQYTSMAIGSDGLGVVSYHDVTNGDLKVARCKTVACTSVGAVIFDAAGVVGQHTSIATGADNIPAISYFDVTRGRLKFLRCKDTVCSGPTASITLDATSLAGQYSALAIGTDGFPVIAYYDHGATDLKVLHCGNAACTVGVTVAALDVQGEVGKYASIAIGTNGLPIVAHYRSDGGNLRMARCANLACSASALRQLDTNGDVGQFAAMTVGVDGVPVVAYHDTAGYLKVARPPAA